MSDRSDYRPDLKALQKRKNVLAYSVKNHSHKDYIFIYFILGQKGAPPTHTTHTTTCYLSIFWTYSYMYAPAEPDKFKSI